MGNIVFNIAKGEAAAYGRLSVAGSSLIVVPLEASGLEADSVLQDYADLASLLAGASNEQTTMGRKTVTPTVATDNTNNWKTVDFPDPVWTAAAGSPVGALLVCYKPAGGSADGAIVPLTKHDFAATPNGGDITGTVNAAGFFKAS